MQFRLSRLTFHGRLRKSQRQVEGLGQNAEANLEQLFFKRIGNLAKVGRFVATWISLLLILFVGVFIQLEGLGNHYQTREPVAGGTYTEGILGTFTTANPLFATNDVDTAVSRLLFSGLFGYNQQNQLVGNLASSYSVDSLGLVYTVHLRPNLRWQDNKPLTADDVVYTYATIQDPDAQSPLASGWQNIKVAKKDNLTVTFTLPTPLSSFVYNLTNGIVPQHLLASVPAGELRTNNFNTVNPVGSGPFRWGELQVEHPGANDSEILIALKPFSRYVGGNPKLDSFVVAAFSSQQSLLTAFKSQQLNGVSGLSSTPSAIAKLSTTERHSFVLTAANMAFFNTESLLLSDVKIRQALTQAVNTPAIVAKLGYITRPVHEPLLSGQLAYDPTYSQAVYNPATAKSLLAQDGWLPGKDGVRYKAGRPLQFTFYATDTTENRQVSSQLVNYWKTVGAKVDLRLQSESDLKNTIAARNYDALLYGISIGIDPDVFVYWDSSQIDPRSTRLNLSAYKSSIADGSLEAGRTRLDSTLRTIKYRSFLQAWQQDAPAVGLYQPRFLYLTNEKVYGLDQPIVNVGTDRYDNVQNWMVRTAKVTD